MLALEVLQFLEVLVVLDRLLRWKLVFLPRELFLLCLTWHFWPERSNGCWKPQDTPGTASDPRFEDICTFYNACPYWSNCTCNYVYWNPGNGTTSCRSWIWLQQKKVRVISTIKGESTRGGFLNLQAFWRADS